MFVVHFVLTFKERNVWLRIKREQYVRIHEIHNIKFIIKKIEFLKMVNELDNQGIKHSLTYFDEYIISNIDK